MACKSGQQTFAIFKTLAKFMEFKVSEILTICAKNRTKEKRGYISKEKDVIEKCQRRRPFLH
jgi:hypothetical protein